MTTRLRERRTSYWWVIGLSVAVSAPVLTVGVVLNYLGRADLSYTFTALGFLLSFLLPILFEQRAARSRPRRVRMIDYRHHEYGHAIFRSISSVLEASGHRWRIESEVVAGPDSARRAVAQAALIKESIDQDVDALVVLPLEANTSFWSSVGAAVAAGIVVIVLDVDAPLSQFESRGAQPPYSVRTDYALGGRLLGQYIVSLMSEHEGSRAIVPMGPPQFYAGRERSRQAAGELVEAGLAERARFLPIEGWDLPTETVDAIAGEVRAQSCFTVVYTAYDANAIPIRRRLTELGVPADQYALIGYDATRDELGRADVFDHGDAVAAIDVEPTSQGATAGRLLVQLRSDPDQVFGYRHLVPPSLLLREDYERELALRR